MLRATFGTEVALRADELLAAISARQAERTMMIHTDGRAELDRLEAMHLLPKRSPPGAHDL